MYNYFINEAAPGDNTGIDWYNAFTDISGALTQLEAIPESSGVNLYIAMGNYYADIDRSQDYMNILGGYVVPDSISSGNIDNHYKRFKSRIVGKDINLNSGTFNFDGIEFILRSGFLDDSLVLMAIHLDQERHTLGHLFSDHRNERF